MSKVMQNPAEQRAAKGLSPARRRTLHSCCHVGINASTPLFHRTPSSLSRWLAASSPCLSVGSRCAKTAAAATTTTTTTAPKTPGRGCACVCARVRAGSASSPGSCLRTEIGRRWHATQRRACCCLAYAGATYNTALACTRLLSSLPMYRPWYRTTYWRARRVSRSETRTPHGRDSVR